MEVYDFLEGFGNGGQGGPEGGKELNVRQDGGWMVDTVCGGMETGNR